MRRHQYERGCIGMIGGVLCGQDAAIAVADDDRIGEPAPGEEACGIAAVGDRFVRQLEGAASDVAAIDGGDHLMAAPVEGEACDPVGDERLGEKARWAGVEV